MQLGNLASEFGEQNADLIQRSLAPPRTGRSAVSVARLPGVFTVPEAAVRAAVSPGTLRKEIREGKLRARRIGRCVRILDEDLAAWLRADGDVQPDDLTRHQNP